jgi:hypothetical protein
MVQPTANEPVVWPISEQNPMEETSGTFCCATICSLSDSDSAYLLIYLRFHFLWKSWPLHGAITLEPDCGISS